MMLFNRSHSKAGDNVERMLLNLEARLSERMTAMERRFDERVAAMEQRFDERMTAMEARLEGVFYRAFFALAVFFIALYGATVGLMIAFFG